MNLRGAGSGKATAAALLVVVAACASARGPSDARSASATSGASDGGAELDASADDASAEDASADASDVDADAEGGAAVAEAPSRCPRNMVLVDERFCVDRYEASLVEALPDGTERAYPHYLPVDGHAVRAVSEPGVFPQGFISELQADDACRASSKRLCTLDEWQAACMGPDRTTFPYGRDRTSGVCNDAAKSPVATVFGVSALAASSPVARAVPGLAPRPRPTKKGQPKGKPRATTTGRSPARPPARTVQSTSKPPKARAPARRSARPASVSEDVWTKLNDPRLGQVDGALSRAGEHAACSSAWGAEDMVGNLHEWVATDRAQLHGTFAGGYFLDTHLNGDGCGYRTVAHAHEYHDYSTGFRCCAEPPSDDVAARSGSSSAKAAD